MSTQAEHRETKAAMYLGVRVVDAWQVIDRWWSRDPVVTTWRKVTVGGVTILQRRLGDEPWRDYTGPDERLLLEHSPRAHVTDFTTGLKPARG